MSQRQRIGDLFLGERVVISYQDLEKVQSGHISLKVLGQTELEKRRAREKFYKKNTIDFVNQFLAKHSEDFNFSEITFKAYRSKWGSCSADNNLNFNLYLSMCPTEVIEYIVVHELCHTRYKNHSRKFYKCVEQYLPDYKKPLDWLRRNRGLI